MRTSLRFATTLCKYLGVQSPHRINTKTKHFQLLQSLLIGATNINNQHHDHGSRTNPIHFTTYGSEARASRKPHNSVVHAIDYVSRPATNGTQECFKNSPSFSLTQTDPATALAAIDMPKQLLSIHQTTGTKQACFFVSERRFHFPADKFVSTCASSSN